MGCDRAWVQKLARTGRLVRAPCGGILPWASVRRIRQTARYAYSLSGDRPDYWHARAVREHYRALAAQREYDQAIAQVVEREAVGAAVEEVVALVRATVAGLPERLAPRLAGIHDEAECRVLLAEEIGKALEELAASLSAAGGEP